jgi:integrase
VTGWDSAIGGWCQSLRAAGLSPATIYQRRWQVGLVAAAYPNQSPWTVSGDQLVAFMANRGWGPEALHSARSALRGFYSWGLDAGRTDRDPSRALRRVRLPRHLPRPAADLVVSNALEHANDKIRLMILLGALAGLRAAEIAKLRWDSIDGAAMTVCGKGGRTRRIPVHPALAAELAAEYTRRADGRTGSGYRYTHHGDVYVFPGQTVGGMHPGHVSHALSMALGPGVTGHQLRHRAATRALRGTGNLRAVQEFLGHSSPSTTAIYTEVDPAALLAAVMATG